MSRAPFQVLVFPYRRTDLGQLEYAVFRRSESEVWQGIAVVWATKLNTEWQSMSYRGPIAIHASAGMPGRAKEACSLPLVRDILARAGYESWRGCCGSSSPEKPHPSWAGESRRSRLPGPRRSDVRMSVDSDSVTLTLRLIAAIGP